jgi:hypothetical protein
MALDLSEAAMLEELNVLLKGGLPYVSISERKQEGYSKEESLENTQPIDVAVHVADQSPSSFSELWLRGHVIFAGSKYSSVARYKDRQA